MKYTIFALFLACAMCNVIPIKENPSNDLVDDLRCAGKYEKIKKIKR